MERWKQIGDSKYEVSDRGRVRSNFHGTSRLLKLGVHRQGYRQLGLRFGRERRVVLVHRLVGEAFVENPQNKKYINHKNGVKDDNRAENLEWVTSAENLKHAFKKGLKSNAGVNNPRTKLSPSSVREIRRQLKRGRTCRELAPIYGVSEALISAIKNKRVWANISLAEK